MTSGMKYKWSIYCEKPVSDEVRLDVLTRLFRGVARVVAGKHIGQSCHFNVQAIESGTPSVTDDMAYLLQMKAIVCGKPVVYEGAVTTVIYSLEMTVSDGERERDMLFVRDGTAIWGEG